MQKLAATIAMPKKFESWHATGSALITTSCAPGQFARPNASNAGIVALRDSLNLGGEGFGPVPANAVTFARSSRGPIDATANDLTWIPFATDGVGFAVKAGGTLDQAFPFGLTTAQLQNIYKCVTTNVNVGGVNYSIQPNANCGSVALTGKR